MKIIKHIDPEHKRETMEALGAVLANMLVANCGCFHKQCRNRMAAQLQIELERFCGEWISNQHIITN